MRRGRQTSSFNHVVNESVAVVSVNGTAPQEEKAIIRPAGRTGLRLLRGIESFPQGVYLARAVDPGNGLAVSSCVPWVVFPRYLILCRTWIAKDAPGVVPNRRPSRRLCMDLDITVAPYLKDLQPGQEKQWPTTN